MREYIQTVTEKTGVEIKVFRCTNEAGDWWMEYEVVKL